VADPAGQAGDVTLTGEATTFRSIETLGELVGRYCWVEHRIFEMTGVWASDSDGHDTNGREAWDTDGADSPSAHSPSAHSPSAHSPSAIDAERRVWCAAVSQRHGALSFRWRERLPVRAGVERAALIAPPEGRLPALLDELAAAADPWERLAGLVRVVLPGLAETYASHLRCASAVSEGPVMEVLVEARREGLRDIRGGSALLQRVPRTAKWAGYGAPKSASDPVGIVERAFDQFGIFPAVRRS